MKIISEITDDETRNAQETEPVESREQFDASCVNEGNEDDTEIICANVSVTAVLKRTNVLSNKNTDTYTIMLVN